MTTDSCRTCGKTSSLMNCKRCKSVAYCSADCQRQDWKTHKVECKRKEFAGAPCDCCGSTEDVEHGGCCFECGSLFCLPCSNQLLNLDPLSRVIVGFEPCPRCHKRRDSTCPRDRKKLEKLIKESPRDPRLARWLVVFGKLTLYFDNNARRGERKAKEYFLRAGELGYGVAFSHVAEIYIKHRNWDEGRRYLRMAADRMHVVAICALACEAALGYFHFDYITQEDHRRPPDLEEAVRLSREGAQLGHAECCARLGRCYLDGLGTEVNHAKGFKWSKIAAEKGYVQGMDQCAQCYHFGKGVEQSDEQAIYWYEKYLEKVDDEDAQSNLEMLRSRSSGSS